MERPKTTVDRARQILWWKGAGTIAGYAIWEAGIIVTAGAFGLASHWWIGFAVFYALNSLNGIHAELIRRRPAEDPLLKGVRQSFERQGRA